jgi:hypothetical protein
MREHIRTDNQTILKISQKVLEKLEDGENVGSKVLAEVVINVAIFCGYSLATCCTLISDPKDGHDKTNSVELSTTREATSSVATR